jgi:RNA polymerase sigma factor (sigma-70 family)
MARGEEMQKCSERDLLASALNGSDEAFGALLRASRPKLLAAARLILPDAEEAEDAVQAAAWNAYRSLSSFRAESSFHTWVTSIAINQARMRRRQLRRSRLVPMEEVQDFVPQSRDSAPGPEAGYAAQELRVRLRREVRRLPAQLRQVMLLYIDDVSMADASRRLGLSLAATKARLFRARRHLFSRMRTVLA